MFNVGGKRKVLWGDSKVIISNIYTFKKKTIGRSDQKCSCIKYSNYAVCVQFITPVHGIIFGYSYCT